MPALRLAHRGDWRRASENTIPAFVAALAVPGCDGLEFDVRAAAGGVPVVIHDDTLQRVQGVRGRVATMTPDELERLVTAIVRSDRFVEGSIEGAFQSGLLARISRRAAALLER